MVTKAAKKPKKSKIAGGKRIKKVTIKEKVTEEAPSSMGVGLGPREQVSTSFFPRCPFESHLSADYSEYIGVPFNDACPETLECIKTLPLKENPPRPIDLTDKYGYPEGMNNIAAREHNEEAKAFYDLLIEENGGKPLAYSIYTPVRKLGTICETCTLGHQ